jgi:lipoprotein-anchoring transpeptidase ErfK/SrfK
VIALGLRVIVLSVVGLTACAPLPEPKPTRDFASPIAVPTVAPQPDPVSIVIRLKARKLEVMRDDRPDPVVTFPIAVGRKGHETPTGRFQVEEMVVHPEYPRLDPADRRRVLEMVPAGPENPLGERWIGFAHGDGWTVGMHGTPHPELLGKAVSGGCIRMRNADVLWLYERVRIGTPVVVQP